MRIFWGEMAFPGIDIGFDKVIEENQVKLCQNGEKHELNNFKGCKI